MRFCFKTWTQNFLEIEINIPENNANANYDSTLILKQINRGNNGKLYKRRHKILYCG